MFGGEDREWQLFSPSLKFPLHVLKITRLTENPDEEVKVIGVACSMFTSLSS